MVNAPSKIQGTGAARGVATVFGGKSSLHGWRVGIIPLTLY